MVADVCVYSIESMKMETVIRSPQKGVVKRLAHKEGVSSLGVRSQVFLLTRAQDICKAGTVLVLFEDADGAESAK
jgi:3-methylcrotonyl-CoA carboxylase alpha subunit